MNDSGGRKGANGSQSNGLTSVIRPGRSDSESFDFELGLPLHGIAVRTHVEQRVEAADEQPVMAEGDPKLVVAPWVEPVEDR